MIDIYDYIKKQINFEIIYTDENSKQYSFKAQIVKVLQDKIQVTKPINKTVDFNIVNICEKLDINFYTEEGILSCNSNLLSNDTANNFVYLSFPYNTQLSQRREKERVPLHADCELNIINSGKGVLDTIFLKTKNISDKGLAFLTDKPLDDFENARILIHLLNSDITAFCKKVYTKEIEFENKIMYINGVIFTEISKNDMRTILKDCMKIQFASHHNERIFEAL